MGIGYDEYLDRLTEEYNQGCQPKEDQEGYSHKCDNCECKDCENWQTYN